jgi:hypothetical protein
MAHTTQAQTAPPPSSPPFIGEHQSEMEFNFSPYSPFLPPAEQWQHKSIYRKVGLCSQVVASIRATSRLQFLSTHICSHCSLAFFRTIRVVVRYSVPSQILDYFISLISLRLRALLS